MTERRAAEETTLQQLLERLARFRGDTEAWELLYRRLWPWVIAHAYRALRGQHDLAEDASQEVFYRLFRYCDFTKLPDPTAFRAYLYTICKNVARDYLSAVIEQSVNLAIFRPEEIVQTEAGPSGQEQLAESAKLLDDLFLELDEDNQTLLRLLLDGCTLPEISQRLRIKYSNAAVRIHRLRRTVRNYLTAKGV